MLIEVEAVRIFRTELSHRPDIAAAHDLGVQIMRLLGSLNKWKTAAIFFDKSKRTPTGSLLQLIKKWITWSAS